jgi:hypothetical protein
MVGFFTFLACGGRSGDSQTTSPPVVHRVLAVSALPKNYPNFTVADLTEARNLVLGAGARGDFASYAWGTTLEPAPSTYVVSQVGTNATNTAGAGVTQQLIGLQVINTVVRDVPTDLATTPWDAALMRSRFKTLLDQLAPGLLGRVTYLSIGNEVDVHLATTGEWAAYKVFLDDVATSARAKWPGVKVGTTVTFGGAQTHPTEIAQLTSACDLLIFTYYPLGAGFVPQDPNRPTTDLPAMVAMAGSRPVVVQEFGYPADSATLGSSETAQATFITSGLTTWASLGARKMPFLNVFLLHDFDPGTVNTLASYYGLPSNAGFKAYLGSLGLRNNNGTAKQAWSALVQGAATTGLP